MKKVALFAAAGSIFLMVLSAFAAESLESKAKSAFKPIPSKAPVLKGNPYTKEKYELGKMLFLSQEFRKVGL